MKLGPVERLVAKLAMSVTRAQMDEMLVKSDLDPWDRGHVSSPVDMLVKLRRRHTSHSAFLATFLKLLENVSDAEQLSETVRTFRDTHRNIDDELSAPLQCNGATLLPRPVDKDKMRAFNSSLHQMGLKLRLSDFEIIKAISPLQESQKERSDTGQKLFHSLKESGRISPNDTELLHDIFNLMDLVQPLNVLREYEEKFLTHDCQPSAPPFSGASQQPPYPTTYPPHRPPNIGYSPLPTGWSQVPRTEAVPETGQPHTLYSRRPLDYIDETYPRPTNSYHSPAPTNLPPAAYPHPPPHQAAVPTAPRDVSTGRGSEDSQQLSNDPYQSGPSPQWNSRVHHFQTQISQTPSPGEHRSMLQPSVTSPHATNTVPSLSQPSIHLPQNTPPGNLHPLPPANITPYLSPPATSTTLPAPSAPPEHDTDPAHPFPAPISAKSTGNHFSLPPQPNPLPAAFFGQMSPCNPRNTNNTHSATSASGLPIVPASNDKLLARHSREMGEHHYSRPSRRPKRGVTSQPSSQRSVFSQGDIRTSVGSSGDNNPAPSEQELNAQNNGMDNRSSGIHTRSYDPLFQPPNATGSLAQASYPDDQSRHVCCPPPPTPPRFTQCSLLVSGPSSSLPGPHSDHTSNPPNTANSQYVSPNSSYDRSSCSSSSLSPNTSAGGSVLVTSHDPSTHSLVDRHKMSEAAKPSSSFATIPEASAGEEEGGERRRLSESESSSESCLGRKRARETKEQSSETSSSSEEDDETSMTSKRLRTEHNSSSGSSKIRSFLSQLIPFSWGKKNTSTSENDSDEAFEDAKEKF